MASSLPVSAEKGKKEIGSKENKRKRRENKNNKIDTQANEKKKLREGEKQERSR